MGLRRYVILGGLLVVPDAAQNENGTEIVCMDIASIGKQRDFLNGQSEREQHHMQHMKCKFFFQFLLLPSWHLYEGSHIIDKIMTRSSFVKSHSSSWPQQTYVE